MKRAGVALVLLALSGCGEEPSAPGNDHRRAGKADPMARTDDLWPGLHRAPMDAMPTAREVESACSKAGLHFIAEMEKGGAIVDPTFYEYPVRYPVCRPEPGSASTLDCRFDQATIYIEMPTAEQREDSLKHMRPGDWEPYRARLVRVGGSASSEWIAPAGCERVPKPARP